MPPSRRGREDPPMTIHLINPSHVSFGIGVITPRWLYVLARATPTRFGDPVITDETLEPLDPTIIARGDIGGAHAVVKGDGDLVWARVLDDCATGGCNPVYEGGQVEPEHLLPARWDLMPSDRY